MERNESLASAIHSKGIYEIESEMKHNSFYSTSDKRIIRTLLGNIDSRQVNEWSVRDAIDLGKKLISKECTNSIYFSERLESLEKRLKGFL